jgi:hypothetical protein
MIHHPPPLLLLAGLLIWGFFADHLLPSILMALALEAPRYLSWRIQLGEKDLYRVADLSAVLFVVISAYLFNRYSIHGIYEILSWQPYIFFPLLLVQSYEQRQTIPLSALFLSVRRRLRQDADADRELDLRYPYLALCLLAASTTAETGWLFYSLVCLLAAWALWGLRSRRYSLLVWATALALGVAIGFFGQHGLRETQGRLERIVLAWMDGYWWRGRDPLQARTAIGSLGRLKLSNSVRIRVQVPEGSKAPPLLRESSYSRFNLGTWSNAEDDFQVVDPIPGTRRWVLADQTAAGSLTIEFDQKAETIVLPLPLATVEFNHPEALEVLRSQVGTVRLEARPGPQKFTVRYGQGSASLDARPLPADREVPEAYAATLDGIVTELILTQLSEEKRIAAIEQFFAENFYYTLIQRGRFPGRLPLVRFLTQERAGHCEYFASAAVLLLRRAGIPARYAVGYSVQEYSELQKRYLVRARHAHSWAEAYVDGQWQVVDTTPARWLAMEEQQASLLQPLYDLFGWGVYGFKRWRRGGLDDDDELFGDWLLWLIPPLILLFVYRLRRAGRVGNNAAEIPDPIARSGLDSEYFQVLERLARLGYPRRPGETLLRYAARLEAVPELRELSSLLSTSTELHYRYRFRPQGILASERDQLNQLCAQTLVELNRQQMNR